jgi:NitT/TauT family transport system ATP-binding protein
MANRRPGGRNQTVIEYGLKKSDHKRLQQQVLIEAVAVEKFYQAPGENRIQVIAPLDLAIHAGQIVALLGPSGSGKSTLLRMLTGLSQPSAGKILRNGVERRDPGNLAIVFQSFALFPWLTVQENVEAPLEARGVGKTERAERSRRALDVVGLDGFEGAYPKELSGGMKQRVGFARALVVEPEVLFMDEPFSALDVLTAENLRNQVTELWADKKLPTQAIFIVTHNIEEAVLLADRIIVLGRNPGRIRTDFQVELAQPRDRKTAAFVTYVDFIYRVLTRPDAEPGALPSAAAPKRESHQMLPHVRPGGIAGLLEMLPEPGQHTDLYKLSSDLGLELDELLPVVEAAGILGFLTVKEGDVEMTELGNRFANADILSQKIFFREAAVLHINLIDRIRRALETKPDHRVRDEFFRDFLDEHFSEEEVQRQLETAIQWGRYSELFDYDAAQKRFFLPEPESAAAE